MKAKFSWMYLAALVAAFTWTSCEPEPDPAPAVGITEIKVTPEGSAVSYTAAIEATNAVVSVSWDITDAQLAAATIEATPTLGSEVFCNEQVVGAGIVVNLTSSVTLVAKGADGKTVAYTVTATRAAAENGDMLVKSSKFVGFPEGLIDYDVTFFNNKFYAITTSVSGAGTEEDPMIEDYKLYSSSDAINWSEVKCNASTEGVDLPEGQDGYVIGGEGARLVVHNGRMHVLGGAHSKGEDIYGNPAEVDDWGFMVMTYIDHWRSFSTTDGVNFVCDTIGAVYTRDEVVRSIDDIAAAHVNVVSFGDKMFMQGGYYPAFGMWQGTRRYLSSVDGKNWDNVTPVSTNEENTVDVHQRMGNAFFVYDNKMWCLGGYKNFVDASMMVNSVWSSEDGVNWTMEVDTVKGFSNIFDAEVLATEEAVYLFGGNICNADGNSVSNKVYRSTDCINWEEVETPEAFTARRHIAGVAQGNSAWLFGGIATPCGDTYGYPVSDTDDFTTETWVKLMK